MLLTVITPDRARQMIGLIDLTNLDDRCDAAAIDALCVAALQHEVAAVCVWPDFVAQAAAAVRGTSVRVATVVNFPTGAERAFAVSQLAARCIDDGADEIDVVFPYRAYKVGDVGHCSNVLRSTRLATAGTSHLKVILETGELVSLPLVAAASRFAIEHGADFIKTSTGKSPVSATPEAVATMLDAIAEADRTVGIKPSGGIRTVADAETYLSLAEQRLGVDWPTAETFRFGASSLLEALLAVLDAQTIKP
jgi:deoxyribose-phosphate aldolase